MQRIKICLVDKPRLEKALEEKKRRPKKDPLVEKWLEENDLLLEDAGVLPPKKRKLTDQPSFSPSEQKKTKGKNR